MKKDITEITWQAPEFEYHPKGIFWYWTSIIVAIILVFLALWQKNLLFAIFVVIAEIIILFLIGKFPPIWEFKINAQGIEIGRINKKEKKFYSYEELDNFDIHLINEEYKELVFKLNSRFSQLLKINIHFVDEERIKKFLLKFLPHEEIPSSLVDSMSKLIRF